MGGSDPNTAVLTAGNAAKNNVFCGGLCIAAVVVAISAAYSAYAGGGNPLAGLDVIAEGKDPIQKMLTTGVAKSVAFSYSRYPNATATVLHTLGDAIDTAGVWVRIVDDKTGNVISDAWDQIPPEYRKKIIGLADLGEMGVTLYVSASAMAKVIQGVKVAEDAGKAVTLGVDAAKGASLPQPGVLTAIEKQVVKVELIKNARYAPKTYSLMFDARSPFAGMSVEDVSSALRSGSIKPSDVPINYIVRDGNTLILNTRSSQALKAAKISPPKWRVINRTGSDKYEIMLSNQLRRNKLTSEGVDTVRKSRIP
ncbi:hypothetical protein [Varunaivibrio sulfuroxidans]|uniref:hypothetical protein n=1 Tax=Varunaivibrio sulfuroxidans TaxID=1773489 RepID=UPI0023E0CD67|nr:hypothetical protein [Varunaivibrio sulfuroxidans]WES32020.1 hypothetical protein P3M64_06600 [Varunaivibrio sulfuroxidans]